MQKLFLVITILCLNLSLQAGTTVYFFEHRNPNGDVYSFDPGGRFYHAALKYKNQIVQAHPYYGVQLTTNLTQVGHLAAALYSTKNVLNLSAKIQAQLGKKFSLYSDWNDPKTTQCSKLVGQIIGVSPVIVQGGNLSLSPDLLYAELIKMNFKPQKLP
jgi:hypothetical protein